MTTLPGAGAVGRWWAAIRALRPIQVYKRLFFSLKRRWRRIGPFTGMAARAAGLRSALGVGDAETFRFEFLGKRVEAAAAAIPWADSAHEKLWRYSLQYCDFLADGSVPERRLQAFLILDWIARHPDDGAEGWEPYPVARRVCRWLDWLEAGGDATSRIGGLVIGSMIAQGRRLWLDLEEHLQANHLLVDLAALFLLSAFLLRRADSSTWREIGRRWQLRVMPLLAGEIRRQILPDGGHEERSPMYHLQMLRDIGKIARAAGADHRTADLTRACEEVLPRMRSWLGCLTHPDGGFALFQDSAFNGFPGAADRLPVPTEDAFVLLPDSGYFTARWGDGHFLALACGAPGPAHQPGHAHADALSFELSLWGERWIVDTGCGSYQNPAVRTACRSSAGHNLPMIAGCEQSEVWGEFRVGRRCRVLGREWDAVRRRLRVEIEEACGNRFARLLEFESGAVLVEDRLLKRVSPGRFQSLLHLAPDLALAKETAGPAAWTLRNGPRSVRLESPMANISHHTIDSCYYPMFGPGVPNSCLVFGCTDSTSEETLRYVLRYAL